MSDREITTISFGRACREKRGMYLSSDNLEALHLGLREIYTNSLDALTETKQKKGEINIIIDSKTREIRVEDNGPGIPIRQREDGLNSVVAAFTLPHTGSHNDARAVSAIGTNGVGGSIVTHTSERFVVVTGDGKQRTAIIFIGTPDGARLETIDITSVKIKGTYVTYSPDTDIYDNVWFDFEKLNNELSEAMRFYPNIKLNLKFDNKNITYYFPNGLKDKKTCMYYESSNLIIALAAEEGEIKPFGNRLYLLQGGAFFSHFRSQLTRIVNDLSGLKLTGNQIQSVFSGYIAIFVNNALFSNQSKTQISNKEVNPEITAALKKELERFSKTDEWKIIIKKLELEVKAEAAAERARNKIKSALDEINKSSKKKVLISDKLKPALHEGKDSILILVEGDSALGSLVQGRDIEHCALFPIRGKIINCLKAAKEDYLDNQEVMQILQILGCGAFEQYNSSKLRYGKVGICSDGDADGSNIACLLITFFYVCLPKFLQEGRLFWIHAPLYIKNSSYIFSENDWNSVMSKKGYKRCKGLGEQTPKETTEAIFGEYKQWEQLKPSSWSTFSNLVEELMGKEVSQRKDRLFKTINFETIKYL